MRNHVRFGFMFAALAGVSVASAEAHADDGRSSTGAAAIKFDQMTGISTGITTGPLGNDLATIEVELALDPVDGGGPLYTVNMPKGALIQATWGTDKKIVFKAQTGSTSDGIVTVRHTLSPKINLEIKQVFPIKVSYDAAQLLSVIPGSSFDYDAKASNAFAPWAWNGVDVKVQPPTIDTRTLFSLGMDKLPGIIADHVTGRIGVGAATTPTFTYRTTKIFLSGVGGAISNGTDELSLPATDGDYMEVMAAVEGEMEARGSISITPFLTIDKVNDTSFGTTFDFGVYSKDFLSPATKVPFQTVTVHIPMPNVHTPATGVNVGDVSVGQSSSKKVTIDNSGEKDAVVSFDSSDPAFTVPGGSITIPAKSSYDLAVKFAPTNANPATATITVKSNDADSPEQTFKIGANGADVGDGSSGAKDSSDGCGCKAAGAPSSSSWASLGLVGLAAALVARRRRRQAAA